MRVLLCFLLLSVCLATGQTAPEYRWSRQQVGDSAELLTLFHRGDRDVPLLSVLRDTLADHDPANDRIMYVWLLTYSKLTLPQRMLAAVPFFYWRVSKGSIASAKEPKPLLNMVAPTYPVFSDAARTILQWTLLDPMTTPIRASSRAYRTNEVDHERLHLEEAIGYLRRAPVDVPGALTSAELHTVAARLELRKRMLGGFVSQTRAEKIGEQQAYEEERVRARNWELLRQCAEKTGLIFEPLDLGQPTADYGMLWFDPDAPRPTNPATIAPVWKLLSLRNPWTDERLPKWKGFTADRRFDEAGRLLPADAAEGQTRRLIPLGIYSLLYPKVPLLMVDFRDARHVRNHEMAQRTINEITAGVIGISHFTNWYYYAGADLYDFVASRHGRAMVQTSRLECYSRFRVALMLDSSLAPDLRSDIQKRVNALAVNPLEASPEREFEAAQQRYEHLTEDAADGFLLGRVQKARRAEVADFGRSNGALAWDGFVHLVTFGKYTRRAPSATFATLDRNRRSIAGPITEVAAGAP